MDKTRLTKEQGAILSAFTGILCGNFSDMHEYIEKIMKRPVFTYELRSEVLTSQIKEAVQKDFESICAL